MSKKNVGVAIVAGFLIINVLLLLIKPFSFSVVACLIYNCLTIFVILIWSSCISVSEIRRKAVSAVLWYGLLWYALFDSVKFLFN